MVSSATTAPARSSSVFVVVVVAWTTIDSSLGATPAVTPRRSIRSANAIERSGVVVGTLSVQTAPVASSTRTASVNVPPMSIPIR